MEGSKIPGQEDVQYDPVCLQAAIGGKTTELLSSGVVLLHDNERLHTAAAKAALLKRSVSKAWIIPLQTRSRAVTSTCSQP
ncbi:hypothetical protein ANN_27691 [Periplaneta americana]|uniref:Uncharacterized protein n=1 Tax=Periplaneta americana TaxID=6978 RepID=A0ABQ8RV06_PERAM|nr:hypothetical protein ANN_27691 [Periplaneta americana]